MITTDDLHFLLEIIKHSRVVEGRQKFQHIVCVLKYRDHIPLGFDFTLYYFGPYSETLADKIQSLVGIGYVREETVKVNTDVFRCGYSLTDLGLKEIQSIEATHQICGIAISDLQKHIDQINMMDPNDLVRLSKTLKIDQKLAA